MQRRIKKLEAAILLLPCLFLAGVAVALGPRASSHLSLPDNRFRLTVNRIEFLRSDWEKFGKPGADRSRGVSGRPRKRARPLNKNEEMLRVYVFVASQGNAPKWWLDDAKGRPDMDLLDVVFTDKNRRQVRYPTFYNGSGRDIYSSNHRYHIFADFYVPRGTSLKGSTITATAWIQGAGKVRFSAPVDASKRKLPDMFDSIDTSGIKILQFTPSH